MKRLVIILFILFIPIISAQSISVSYPESIESGRQFNLNLKLIDFKNDTYDVKIEILGRGERIARVLNYGEWKSTYYYVNNAVKNNEETIFQLELNNYTGDAEIEIKIKDSKGNLNVFANYTMNILEKPEEDEGGDTYQDEYENQEDDTYIYSTINNTMNNINRNAQFEPLKLDSKSIKITNSNQELEKTKYATYSLIGFCIFLFFLFSLNFLRKKYERREN